MMRSASREDGYAPAQPFDGQAALAEAFAQQVQRWAVACGASVESAAAAHCAGLRVMRAVAQGHVCVLLQELDVPVRHDEATPPASGEAASPVRGEAQWRRLLEASGVVGSAGMRGAPPGAEPLVLDADGRLTLRRLFDAEARLAHRLAALMGRGVTAAALATAFTPTLPPAPASLDWQQVAMALAARQRLTVISGGPGTGKTTTVVGLLVRLLQADPGLRIALAAPTGKAAARLAQSVRERAAQWPQALRGRLPTEAVTLHRLLGAGPRGFAHDATHLLAFDVVVVDEASMLDVELATRLFDAIPDTARVVLLGDQDQLAAVEAGAVFAELSANPTLTPATARALAADLGLAGGSAPAGDHAGWETASPRGPGLGPDHTVWLQQAYRFQAGSAIGALAAEVRDGRARAALERLSKAGSPGTEDGHGLTWIDDGSHPPGKSAEQAALRGFDPYFEALRADPTDHAAVWEAFERFRVLCALREGPRGVEGLNARISAAALQAVPKPLAGTAGGGRSPWFTGRPVMVTRNDSALRLANGDIGLALPERSGGWSVVFREGDGTLRALPVARLPVHETAFAMTVHKAQGSEFDRVAVFLGPDRGRTAPRELLYTGITRARAHVTLVATAAAVQRSIELPTRRRSGLAARLQEALGVESPSS